MSKIITPTDTITITIDNTQSPAPADMRFSRELPAPYVIALLCGLAKSLAEQMMQRMTAAPPPPPASGSAKPQ